MTVPTASEPLEADAQRSALAWRALGLRVKAITPLRLARIALVLGALGGVFWLISAAWSQLLPFQVGIVLAYVTLPLVNALDRLMPRWLAAILLVILELMAVLALIGLLIPPLAQEVVSLVQALPSASELQDRVAELKLRMESLPAPTQNLLHNGLDQLTNNLRTNLFAYVQNLVGLVLASVFGLFNTIGFVLGLLTVPTWLVAVLSDQKAGKRSVDRLLPSWLRADFWAVIRILDRTFGAFVRGQLFLAAMLGCLTYVGLALLERVGLTDGHYKLILSVVAGVMQLIPTVGPILGAIPAVGVGLSESQPAALALLGLYVGLQFVLGTFIAPHVEDRYVDVHPAVFVVVLVLLSQFGFIWVLLAAPVGIVLRDLFLYTLGRLHEPPRPAGVLPREAAPIGTQAWRPAGVARRVSAHG